MKFSFTLFFRQIRPITKLVGRLLALHVRFHKLLTLKTNLHQYWNKFGFTSTMGIEYFSRSKDFGKKDWLLLPFYTLFKLTVWAVYIAYYIVLIFVPILQIPAIFYGLFNIVVFFFWIAFLSELQKRIEVDLLTEEIKWDKVFKEKKEG